ncbi:MAG: rod shape-determining protein MreC [Candidatus Methylacidiphilales bacterium]|nr:rod shape-determining protein MreC [Candidatus Methylacidiphilales bacterium]
MRGPALYLGVLAAVLLALGGFFLSEGLRTRVHQASHDLLSPVFRVVGWGKYQSAALRDRLRSDEETLKELQQLRADHARLSAENGLFRGQKEEIARLREMMAFRQESNYKLLAARVIERDPSNWWNAVIIDRGYEDEPALMAGDQPVVSPRGVVGKTVTVGRYSTRVILLVDENCKISAVSESSRSRGIVQGSTAINGGKPQCRFTFISRESELSVGERVFTTGLGGAFPANLLVGTVAEAPPLSTDRNFGLYRDGVVQPTADLNDLQEVFVILGLK